MSVANENRLPLFRRNACGLFARVQKSTSSRRSVSGRMTILARFAGADPRSAGKALDGLVAAVGPNGSAEDVALQLQRAQRRFGETAFEIDLAAIGHHAASRLLRRYPVDARRITGLLQIHAKIYQVDHDLHVPLWLHVAAHHTKAHPGLAVLGDEGRDDGVEWALPRRIDVCVARFERELLAAVVEDES